MDGFDRVEWFSAAWRPPVSARRACLVGVVAVHAAVALAWWQLPPMIAHDARPPRIMATVMSGAPSERPPETPTRAIPKPAPPKQRIVAPSLATTRDAPPEAQPSSMPATEATAPTAAAPVTVAAPVEIAVAPATAVAPPPPVVAPRFDAAYLDNAPPSYPTLARQFREQGVVMLDVRVTPAGTPDAVEVRVSSGSARLDEAARAAVLRWRFLPARQGTTPVTAWVVVPIRFALNG